MAKSNNFKRPVSNQELIIDEEDKNKKLIVIICLSIIVVLGLIVASVSYFSSKDVEEDKKNNNDDNNKPVEIIKPVVDEPKEDEPKKPIVINRKPNNNVVAVTPGEEEDAPLLVKSVNENDYSVSKTGNTYYVEGVSRYIGIGENGETNLVQLSFLLENYSGGKVEVSASSNKVTDNASSNKVTDNAVIYSEIEPDEDGNYYLDWIHPVGNGKLMPTSVTIKYDGKEESYNIDLSGLRAERQVEENSEEDALFVVPASIVTTNTVYTFPYEIEVYRQLTVEEIDWLKEQESEEGAEKQSLESNEPGEMQLAETPEESDEAQIGENPEGSQEQDDNKGEDKVLTAGEPNYSDDLWYTVKFKKQANSNDTELQANDSNVQISQKTQKDNLRVIKVYAPVLRDDEGQIIAINPEKVIITGVTDKEEDGQQILGVVYENETDTDEETGETYTKYYTYLGFKVDETETEEDVEEPNRFFTIDWDGNEDGDEGKNYGRYTYEFDLSGLKEEEKEEDTPTVQSDTGVEDIPEIATQSEPDVSNAQDVVEDLMVQASIVEDGMLD